MIVSLRESRSISVQKKSVRDLVTRADRESEELIKEIISQRFPGHRFLGEESAGDISTPPDMSGPVWIIDPVDGTTNYAHGHPSVGISIAFAVDGKVLVGVVGSPFQNETFEAIIGQGAQLNGNEIKVSGTSTLSDALIATGFPYDRSDIEGLVQNLRAVLPVCRDLRRIGAAALDLCWVACGRLDGFYETLLPWDMAAGRLIAIEAGAIAGNFGVPRETAWAEDLHSDKLLVANKGVFEELLGILR